jgi:hypothetical protein
MLHLQGQRGYCMLHGLKQELCLGVIVKKEIYQDF